MVGLAQLQVCQITFDVCVTPGAEQEVHALLVDDASIGLQERTRRQSHAVQHCVVLESASDERADAATVEDVIQQECGLTQRTALLVLSQVEPLDARERACLHIAPALHETEVELTFLAAGIVHVFALGLYGLGAISTEG